MLLRISRSSSNCSAADLSTSFDRLGFPVGDFADDTLEVLQAEIDKLQKDSDPAQFRTAKIILKSFGANFD